jgi:hypothetical protein
VHVVTHCIRCDPLHHVVTPCIPWLTYLAPPVPPPLCGLSGKPHCPASWLEGEKGLEQIETAMAG